jgi:hypothetical protein
VTPPIAILSFNDFSIGSSSPSSLLPPFFPATALPIFSPIFFSITILTLLVLFLGVSIPFSSSLTFTLPSLGGGLLTTVLVPDSDPLAT